MKVGSRRRFQTLNPENYESGAKTVELTQDRTRYPRSNGANGAKMLAEAVQEPLPARCVLNLVGFFKGPAGAGTRLSLLA